MNHSFFKQIDSSFQQSLTNLNLEECQQLRSWLNGRINYLKNIPHIKKKIKDLNLSPRAYNALFRNGFITVEDVVLHGVENMALLKNVGTKTLTEIRDAIEGKTL